MKSVTTPSLRYGYADTSRGQIHYAEAGAGPTLLLLSESPRSHRQYRKAIPLFAKHFRVIAIDTPGYGNSHPAPTPVAIPSVTKCIVEFLDSMKIDRTHVFGLHTGNKIGSALSADWPQRVGRLVLAGQTHSIIPDQVARNAAIYPIFEGYTPKYAESADGMHWVRQWLATNLYANNLWWPPKLNTAKTVSSDDIDGIEAQVIDYLLGWRNVVPMYQAVFDFDLADAYRRIKAQTLVVELTTPGEVHLGPQAEAVCALIADSRTAKLEISHLAALEDQAEALVELVLPFLTA